MIEEFRAVLGLKDRRLVEQLYTFKYHIKHEKPCLTTFPNTEQGVEKTTRSEVFSMNLEVFGDVVKHCLECLIHLFNRN